jgi:hypothetical protein
MDLPRSALVELAQKRTYDGSRRYSGFASVAKAVGQHRLLGQAADARSLHLSAANTAHALVHFAHDLLMQASSAAASYPCMKLVADAMGALEQHISDVQLTPPWSTPFTYSLMLPHIVSMHTAAVVQQMCREGLTCLGTRHVQCNIWLTVYSLMQTANTIMLVMATVEIIDEGRLQAWLAAHAQRQGPTRHLSEASADRAAQLMVLWRQLCTCQQPADVLAEAARRLLACARCIKYDPASGMVDVYSQSGDGRAMWKAVTQHCGCCRPAALAQCAR